MKTKINPKYGYVYVKNHNKKMIFRKKQINCTYFN